MAERPDSPSPTPTLFDEAPPQTSGEPSGKKSQEEKTMSTRQSQDLESSPIPSPVEMKEEKIVDPNEVGFDSEEDSYRPLNTSILRKWLIVGIVSSGAICVTCASSMGASTYTGIEESFGISAEVATLTISLFVAGLGCGPLLLGPLSEFWGRRNVYLLSFVLFFLFNIPIAFANNAAVHLIFRFGTGFVGAAFLSVAGGTITDIFSNATVGTPMAIYSISPFLGPVLGPLIGGFINQNTSWRWTYYLLIIWSALELVLIAILVPETYLPAVLRIKARRLRRETGNKELYAPIEKSEKTIAQSILFSCKTPFLIIATQPMAVLLNLWTSILLGILYLFFNAFPIIFSTLHNFSKQQVGMTFLGIGVGQCIGAAAMPWWSKDYAGQAEKAGGKAPPEARLRMGMAGAVCTPIGLFWFAFTSYQSVHWIVPIIGSVFFGMGIVWTFSSVFTYLVDAYRPVAASAMASNSFMRSSFAAGFPLFGRQMYLSRLGLVGASALLAGLTLLMAPLPFVFFRIGHRFRGNNRFS